MPERLLHEIFADQLANRNITPDALSLATGIPVSYINALLAGNKDSLPPLPYIRGYLLKLAARLDLDQDMVLAAYRTEYVTKMSGSSDRLPTNRFAITGIKRGPLLIGAIIIVLIIGFFGVRETGIFGRPYLNLINPPPGDEVYVTNFAVLEIEGRVSPRDTVTINGQAVAVSDTGSFTSSYPLSPELNSLEFVVKRFLGKEVRVLRQVYYNAVNENPDSQPNL